MAFHTGELGTWLGKQNHSCKSKLLNTLPPKSPPPNNEVVSIQSDYHNTVQTEQFEATRYVSACHVTKLQ